MQIAPSKFDWNPFQFNFIFIQLKFQIHSTQTFCPIQLKKKNQLSMQLINGKNIEKIFSHKKNQ